MNRFCASTVVILSFALRGPACLGRESGLIGVLAAMDSELGGLKKEVEIVGTSFQFGDRSVYQARFEGRRMLLAKTGATPEAARAMAQWLVNERQVSAVISVGPAGSLSEELQVGDVVTAESAVNDGREPGATVWDLRRMKDCDVKPVGKIVTVSAFMANSSERARLRERYHADLVDMSAAEIAGICANRRIPCVIVRQVSDRADEEALRAFARSSRSKQPETIQPALCAIRQLGLGNGPDEHN